MKNNYKVYVHINKANGKRYYGFTGGEVEKRWKNGKGYKKQPYFYNDILLYGWDNFTHEILFDNLTKEEAKWLEKMYIALYETTNEEKGYNVSLGYIPSEETKAKLSKAMSGENNPNYGKRGELSYWYGKCGKDNPMATKVYCVELDMYFDTVTEASEYVGCGQQNISNVLIGTNSTACGYHWLYANEVNEENINKVMSKEYNTHGNSKRIYCVELDKYFNSITEASKYIGCGHSSISKALTGKQKTCAKGYHWMYAEDVENKGVS